MNIPILSDVFDITTRLKEIDPYYFVIFNTKKQTFELHCSNQLFTTYCLTLPFESLDERTINLALKTRKQNQKQIINEMEQENKNLENKIQRRMYGS